MRETVSSVARKVGGAATDVSEEPSAQQSRSSLTSAKRTFCCSGPLSISSRLACGRLTGHSPTSVTFMLSAKNHQRTPDISMNGEMISRHTRIKFTALVSIEFILLPLTRSRGLSHRAKVPKSQKAFSPNTSITAKNKLQDADRRKPACHHVCGESKWTTDNIYKVCDLRAPHYCTAYYTRTRPTG